MVLHRVMWLKFGGRRLHLLKTAGAFFVFAAVLKLAASLYELFQQVDVVRILLERGSVSLTQGILLPFTYEDALGVILGPLSHFLFWFGIAVLALIVYQAGNVVVPIDEYEERVADHHRTLIQKAVTHHQKSRKK
ncbi:MAG: hypothetical protein Q8P02_03435 [Candidatus Micrarchaeota archaeon]|nr:hypothetical protein [Candidatus Micrarchaeota archaeon]